MASIIDVGGTFFSGLVDGAADIVSGVLGAGQAFLDFFPDWEAPSVVGQPSGLLSKDIAAGVASGAGAMLAAQGEETKQEGLLQRKQMEIDAAAARQTQAEQAKAVTGIGQPETGPLAGVKAQTARQIAADKAAVKQTAVV